MTKDKWKQNITRATKALNTYRKEFDPVIEALAEILEQRDAAYKDFLDSGAESVTEFISDRGATNMKKNPRLAVWMDLNTQALAFWRDLGMSPSGLKKLNDAAMKEEKKVSALAEAIKALGG